jgi:C-terminal processing protease CtpA/Prc
VDRAYVDKEFNGQTWFRVREAMVKSEVMRTRADTYAAIRKLLASLDDPFTRFLDPDQYDYVTQVGSGARGAHGAPRVLLSAPPHPTQAGTGSLIGVGLEIAPADDGAGLVVVAPAAGGPAERAGVLPLDRIVSVEGEPAQLMGMYEAAELLQGPEGSTLAMEASRPFSGAGAAVACPTACGPRRVRSLPPARRCARAGASRGS